MLLVHKLFALSCLLAPAAHSAELTMETGVKISAKGKSLGTHDSAAWLDKTVDPKQAGDVISAFYLKNVQSALRAGRSKVNDGVWYPAFTCKAGRIETVREACAVTEGELTKDPKQACSELAEMTVSFVPGDGYAYRHRNPRQDCFVTADDKGIVTSSSHSCGETKAGDDFFRHHYFYGFTRLADQCCSVKGCMETVDANMEQLRKNYVVLAKKARDAEEARKKARDENSPLPPEENDASTAK